MPSKRKSVSKTSPSRPRPKRSPVDPEPIDLETFYREYIDCLNQRDWERLDQFVSSDVAHNDSHLGVEGYRSMLERDVDEIPDLRFEGTFLGLPVNGRRVQFCENVFYRVEGGRIVEVRSVLDKAALEARLAKDSGDSPSKRALKGEEAIEAQDQGEASSSGPNDHASSKPKAKATKYEPTDEFQQVTKPDFVKQYKVDGLGDEAEVYYQPDFIPSVEAERWYAELLALSTYQPQLKMYGRTFPQSRHIAAYSTHPNATLSYSGSKITMHHPFPPILEEIRIRLERALGVRFNHVMLNRYDDGSVYIGRHSDNLNNLVIASISIGAERTFIMSPRLPSKAGKKNTSDNDYNEDTLKGRKNGKWTLKNGSLVLMQGRTQEYWKHEIPKEPSVKSGRISLTFRQLV